MTNMLAGPRIGQWYRRESPAETFQVTGLDERAGTVEIQSSDGDIGEIDRDTWLLQPLSYAEPPEDAQSDEFDADDLAAVRAEATLDDPAVLARMS